MRSYGEYLPCSCGAWARIVRAEDNQHRDMIVCAKCGRVTIADNIPAGRRVELKEDEGTDWVSVEGEDDDYNANSHLVQVRGRTMEEATEAWNRRADDE